MAPDLQPHALLARALRTLSDEEQGIVLQHVLATAGLATAGLAAGSVPPLRLDAARAALALELATQTAPAGEKVGLLVRLPAETHSRLKQWCDSNGHSMNVVVRGLVEQFLDSHISE